MSDNGDPKPEQPEQSIHKTKEELLAEKTAKFTEHPEMFISLEDIVCASFKNGRLFFNQAPVKDMKVALFDLYERGTELVRTAEIQQEQKNAPKILKPSNKGIMSFVRGRINK